jgi:serine protease Do
LLLLASALRGQEPGLAEARARVRALEEDLRAVIAKVSPAVGAVTNHLASFDEKTGAVAMTPRSVGSGTVVTPDGFFLTNVHVVEGAGYLTVALGDGVVYPAVLHADTSEGAVKGDIALLKLRGKKRFPFVDWRAGRSGRLEPGSFVLAAGNPRGYALDGTPVFTLGILSGTGRAAAESGYLYVDALQTDAEINPGNSGGPLFDAAGDLVGVNGLMASRQGLSNSGVGFAIPIDQVQAFMRRLLKDDGGGVGYGYHGLHVASADREGGAVVQHVDHGSPAAGAGIRVTDVLLRVNGAKIANRTDFVNVVGKLPEGVLVKVAYRRGRGTRSATFRLGAFRDFRARPERTGPLPLDERGYLGAHWEDRRDGLTLTRVLAGTGARKARLEPGDRVVECDGRPVACARDLAGILALLEEGASVVLAVERGGSRRTAKVELCGAAAAAELGG